MHIKTNRILMNEADASPGNGAPVASPAPAEQPAQAAPAPAAAVTIDQVKGLMTEMLTGFKNATFAELRKAGALGKEKTASDSPSPSQPTQSAPSAQAGLSMADVEGLLERERVITNRATKHGLSDAQVKRLKSSLGNVAPESFASEVDAYLADMGLVKSAESTPVTPVPQPLPAGAPLSDKGSPAPGGVVNWEREFAENPIGMSAAARAAMDAKYGLEKARKMRLEAGHAQAARIKVTAR